MTPPSRKRKGARPPPRKLSRSGAWPRLLWGADRYDVGRWSPSCHLRCGYVRLGHHAAPRELTASQARSSSIALSMSSLKETVEELPQNQGRRGLVRELNSPEAIHLVASQS